MAMQKAPGKSFLKITGIFYIIIGVLSGISALLVRFIYLGTIDEVIPRINRYLYVTAKDALSIWKLTPVNSVLAVLERLKIKLPESDTISISYFADRLPKAPMSDWYALFLRNSISLTFSGILLTFVAVIISIFIIFIGIMSLRYCEPSKRSKLLVIFALINLVMMIISTILVFSFFSFLGCVIAVLYLVRSVRKL